MAEKKRTQVEDIDRSMYDFRYDDSDAEKPTPSSRSR